MKNKKMGSPKASDLSSSALFDTKNPNQMEIRDN